MHRRWPLLLVLGLHACAPATPVTTTVSNTAGATGPGRSATPATTTTGPGGQQPVATVNAPPIPTAPLPAGQGPVPTASSAPAAGTSITGQVKAPASMVTAGQVTANNGSTTLTNHGVGFGLLDAAGPDAPIGGALLYLTNRDGQLFFDNARPFTATSDASGRYTFGGRLPVGQDVLVTAELNADLRFTAYLRPTAGLNALDLTPAGTLAAELLRGEAQRQGKAPGDFKPEAFADALARTQTALNAGDMATAGSFDFRADRLTELRNRYVVAMSAVDAGKTSVKAVSDAWKTLLGARPAAVTTVLPDAGHNDGVAVSRGGDVFVSSHADGGGRLSWLHPDGRVTSLWLPNLALGAPAGLCIEQDAPAGQSLDAVQDSAPGSLLVADPGFNWVARVPIVDHALWRVKDVEPRFPLTAVAGDPAVGNPDHPVVVDQEPASDNLQPATSDWRAYEEGARTYRVGDATHPAGSAIATPARYAHVSAPADVKVDELGSIYIADQGNQRIRFIPSAKAIARQRSYFGYHAPVVDATGLVTGFSANPTDMVAGCIYTIAGNPDWLAPRWLGGYQNGDTVPAYRTHLNQPTGLAVHSEGSDTYVYVADLNNQRIRRIARSTGAIATFAGNPPEPMPAYGLYPPDPAGDGGPAVACRLSGPRAIDFDSAGRAYIADADSGRVRMVDGHGIITTVAGRAHTANSPDTPTDGEALHGVDLFDTARLALDPHGNLLFNDNRHQRVRKLWRQWE